MTPDQYWGSSLREVFLMIKGYALREGEAWQRMRFEAYLIYCTSTEESKRVPIYEFLKLNGDPTAEEIEKMRKDEEENRIDEAVAIYNSMKDYL